EPHRVDFAFFCRVRMQVLKDFAGELIQLYFHHACAFTQLLGNATYEMSNACRRVKNVDLIHAFQSEMKQAFPDGTDDVEVSVVGIQCRRLKAFQLALFELLVEHIFSALHDLAVAEADIACKHLLLVLVRQSVLALQLFHQLDGFQVVIELVSRAPKMKTEVRGKIESSHKSFLLKVVLFSEPKWFCSLNHGIKLPAYREPGRLNDLILRW